MTLPAAKEPVFDPRSKAGKSRPETLDSPSCSICGRETVAAFEIHDHQLWSCQPCHHLQLAPLCNPETHVSHVYDDDYFFGGGDGYADYLAAGEVLERQGVFYRDTLVQHGLIDGSSGSGQPPASVLDVGCAAGFVLHPFAAGFTALGVEPNGRLAAYARDRLGLRVEHSSVETFLDRHQVTHDAILLIQVIAHLDRPERVLRRLVERLNPGGLLLIETWDRQSLTARIFGKKWHELSPPSVRHWFSRDSLDRLSETTGLVKVDHGRARKRLQWQHARGLISHKLGDRLLGRVFDLFATLLPSRFVLPYPGNDPFWALYRKR